MRKMKNRKIVKPFILSLAGILLIALNLSSANAMEFGMFKEHTFYTWDKEGFKDRIVLVFHGLGSAQPNGRFKRLQAALNDQFSIVGVNYDYTDIDKNISELDKLWKNRLIGHKVYVVGTSLGGFWADYFANKYGADKLVVVNPVTLPKSDLAQFLGERYSDKRQKYYTITPEDLDAYGELSIEPHPRTESLVVLARDDKIINYVHALKKYLSNDNSIVIAHGKGGHSLPFTDPIYFELLKAFLDAED